MALFTYCVKNDASNFFLYHENEIVGSSKVKGYLPAVTRFAKMKRGFYTLYSPPLQCIRMIAQALYIPNQLVW